MYMNAPFTSSGKQVFPPKSLKAINSGSSTSISCEILIMQFITLQGMSPRILLVLLLLQCE